ncbi:hypothetical protein [Nonomuraea fuscirosea]|uniref:hypothetical protein n=1 Tax=Nonomuraea fuscirosea TaxID=1291556 RepID=UPI0033D63B38
MNLSLLSPSEATAMTTTAYAPTGHTPPVGRTCEISAIYAVRTPQHLATVLGILARDDFHHATNNPFDQETADFFALRGHNFVGPCWFLWFDTSGELHATRIGKSGIIRELTGTQATKH